MSSLYDALCAFDGKAVTLLSEAQAKFGSNPSFLSELVTLVGNDQPNVSSGATWLIKSNLENGIELTQEQTKILFANLNEIISWQAQLHVCQVFEYLDVPEDQASSVAEWLTHLLQHKRPFLRAWSMSAFQFLAAQHKKFSIQADAALTDAEKDSSASVRARARNIRKK